MENGKISRKNYNVVIPVDVHTHTHGGFKGLKNQENKEKGITLIALVITIIVLLILAGVAIVTLSGDNGILDKAQSAKTQTDNSQELEQIQLAATTAKTNEDYVIDKKILFNELKNMKDISLPEGINIAEDITFPLIVTGKTGKEYKITEEGKVYAKGSVTLPEGLAIGSEVTYTPSETYKWEAKYCSSSKKDDGTEDVTLDSSTDKFKISSWKVFKIDEYTGEVQLVPSNPTRGEVYLGQAQGYNNGVKLLNDACSKLYGKEEKGIKARSINIEDIKSVIDYNPTSYTGGAGYGNRNSTAYSQTNSKYPIIYGMEKDRKIDGKDNLGGLGLSDQETLIERKQDTGKITGVVTTSSSIQPKQTYYYLSNSDFKSKLKSNYKTMLLPKGSSTNYWVASRCVSVNSSRCSFDVRDVYFGYLRGYYMYRSNGSTDGNSRPLFPVVSLSSKLIEGNATSGFSIK